MSDPYRTPCPPTALTGKATPYWMSLLQGLLVLGALLGGMVYLILLSSIAHVLGGEQREDLVFFSLFFLVMPALASLLRGASLPQE